MRSGEQKILTCQLTGELQHLLLQLGVGIRLILHMPLLQQNTKFRGSSTMAVVQDGEAPSRNTAIASGQTANAETAPLVAPQMGRRAMPGQ